MWPKSKCASLVLCLPALVGCGGPDGSEGDCNLSIGFEDMVYSPHNEVDGSAPAGKLLGTGDQLDCDNSPIGSAEVYAVKGVDSAVAIRVKGPGRGIYVAEGVPVSAWPERLKEP